jgi:hypothetical protein
MAVPEHVPASLVVVPWHDEVVEAVGYSPTSPYVEWCWLPVLGPSASWLYRRFGLLAASCRPAQVDLVDLAVSLGVGEGIGRNSIVVRALARLELFDVARWDGGRFAVRTALPVLPSRHVRRLSASARAVHERLTQTR